MRVLVVGGSGFLGGNVVDCAVQRGHTVSAIQRSKSLKPDVEDILIDVADSDGLKNALVGKEWDCVIDMGPLVKPGVVRNLSSALKSKVKHYTFISSIGVYKDFSNSVNETSALADTLDDSSPLTGATFGGLKVGCEKAVTEVMGEDKSLVIRPGLIVGPSDSSGRFAYWVQRFSRKDNDPVVAPESPDWPTQAIDVRDLAYWIVSMVESHETGIYNAVISYKMSEVMEACQQLTPKPKEICYVSGQKLIEHGIKPYSEIPLWAPESIKGLITADCRKASQKGLKARPISETVRDTAKWLQQIDENTHNQMMKKFYSAIGSYVVGLSPGKETSLLA